MARGVDFLERSDGKWEWHLTDGNNQIIATSGMQGYEDVAGAHAGFANVVDEIVHHAKKYLLAEAKTVRQPEEGGGA